MANLLNANLETLNAGSNYGFSATKIKDLGAPQYTLVSVVIDASSSVESFAPQLELMLKTVYKACDKSPRRDNLMLRVTQFASRLTELHGFKLFGSIKDTDYDNILKIGGCTALYDAMDESISATSTYGAQLHALDYQDNNAIVIVITDGESNTGNIGTPAQIKKTLVNTRKAEKLGSILTILIGVTNDDNNLNSYLQTLKDEAGFDQYVSIGNASAGKIAKLAAFVSQSISSTSAALGSGMPSTPINPAGFKF